jgi:hypothetical protein
MSDSKTFKTSIQPEDTLSK